MIKFSEILGRGSIENGSEFFLMLCMAADVLVRGSKLDVSDVRVCAEDLTDDLREYYKYLRSVGAFYESDSDVEMSPMSSSDVSLYMDMRLYHSADSILVDEESDCYVWNSSMLERYRSGYMQLGMISNMGKFVMHLIGYMIISEYIGEKKIKPLRISYSNIYVKNLEYYFHPYLLGRSWLGSSRYFVLDVDFAQDGVDIEYQVFCKKSRDAGRHKLLSVKEKIEKMAELGITTGSIVVMYSRGNINASNPSGKITRAIIARIDEVGEDYIGYLTIPLNRTKEEIKADYDSMSESGKEIYGSDMLNYEIATRPEISNLYSIGVGDCFYTEDTLMELIDGTAMTEKMITIDGNVSSVEMSEIDAIYWLMCQFEIPFDRELYRKMYGRGKDLLWDLYADDSEEYFDVGNF